MQKYSKITITKNLNNEIKLHYLVYQFTCHLQMIILQHNLYTRDRVCPINKYSTAEEKKKMVLT